MATVRTGFVQEGQDKLSDVDRDAREAAPVAVGEGSGEWKDIQKKAFINWFNVHLRQRHAKLGTIMEKKMTIGEELGDGLELIALLEQLSNKKFPRHNKKPRIKQQRLENLLQALRFLAAQDVKLVNIGAEDLLSGSEKLWMGLIWSLIGKYAIRLANKRMTAKQAMQGWLEAVIPDQKITNFSTSWNSGIALCALVDAIQPGACPDHASLDPKNGLENCELGMELAEKHLGIPRVFDACDLNNSKIDERSVMTYLSLFTKRMDDNLLQWIQAKIPEFNITGFTKDWHSGVALAALNEAIKPGLFPGYKKLNPKDAVSNVSQALDVAKEQLGIDPVLTAAEIVDPKLDGILMCSYLQPFQYCRPVKPPTAEGPGLMSADVGKLAEFTVDTTESAEGDLSVAVVGPHSKLNVNVSQPHSAQGIFMCTYSPVEPGIHTISIDYGESLVSESPYKVPVIDVSKCTVTGPPIEEGVIIHQPYFLTASTAGTGTGNLEATVTCPGKEPSPAEVVAGPEDTYRIQGLAGEVGVYQFDVVYAGRPVPKSPFIIHASDPDACKLLTTIKSDYIHMINTAFQVKVDKKLAGTAPLHITYLHDGTPKDIEGEQDAETGVVTGSFLPGEPGHIRVDVKLHATHIHGSPLVLPVVDPSLCTLDPVKQHIPVGERHHFHVQTSQPVKAPLEGKIYGQDNCDAPVLASHDRTMGEYFDVSFIPESIGSIKLSLVWAGQEIPGSPVDFAVFDASRCKLVSILEKVRQGEDVPVVAAAQNAGTGQMSIIAVGPTMKLEGSIKADKDHYSSSLTAEECGALKVHVNWCGKPIPGSPYTVDVLPKILPSQIFAKGHGLQEAFTKTSALFAVMAPDSGLLDSNQLTITAKYLSGKSIDITCKDEGNGKYLASYTPMMAGHLSISILLENEHTAMSPYELTVLEQARPDLCRVSGKCVTPGQKLFTDEPLDIHISTRQAGHGHLSVVIMCPDGKNATVFTADQEDGHLVRFDARLAGEYTADVKWSTEHIPKSPFCFTVNRRLQPHDLKASGSGLRTAWTNTMAEFTVEADDMEKAHLVEAKQLYVAIRFPPMSAGSVVGNSKTVLEDETALPVTISPIFPQNSEIPERYCVEYMPIVAGDHMISVKYRDHEIPGSNFRATVRPLPNASKCVVEAEWLQSQVNTARPTCPLKQGNGFKLNIKTDRAGEGQLSATGVHLESRLPVKTDTVLLSESAFGIQTDGLDCPGQYRFDIQWSGEHVPGSPFYANVDEQVLASQITASGDGLREGWTDITSEFVVDTAIQGVCQKGDLQVQVVPESKKSADTTPAVPASIGAPQGKLYSVQYTAKQAGVHMISIMYKEKHIHGSPFRAVQKQSPDASQCKVSASWLPEENATDGAKVNKASYPQILQGTHVQLTVDSGAAGIGELTATMHNESKKAIEVLVAVTSSPDKYKVAVPVILDPGSYSMDLMWSGKALPASPVKFDILHRLEAADMSASGEGLVTGWTNDTCKFVVHAEEKGLYLSKRLRVTIQPAAAVEGEASKSSLKVLSGDPAFLDNGDGTYSVEYMPNGACDHLIAIQFESKDIPGSPFRAAIKQQPDASKCKLSIPGRDTAAAAFADKLLTGDDAELAVDTSEAGDGQLNAETTHEESGDLVDTLIVVRANGMYGVLLKKLSKAGTYQVSMKWSGQHVPGSPKKITVAERLTAAMISASGDGLKNGWTKRKSLFVVNTPQSGLKTSKRLQVKVAAPQKSMSAKGSTSLNARTSSPDDLVVAVTDNADGTYHVEYEPRKAGDHVVDIVFDGQSIPGSPYSVPVSASPDATLCVPGKSWRSLGNKADKTGSSAKNDDTHLCGDGLELEVDTSNGGVGELSAMAKNKDGDPVETFVVSGKNGKKSRVILPNVPNSGEYHVDVLWSGVAVKGSPFKVKVLDRLTADQITASGDGLHDGWTGMASKFVIDTAIQGVCQKGDLQVQVVPETEKPADTTSAIPSTIGAPHGKLYSVQYTAKLAGVHMISIMYKEKHIHGSPFRAVQKQSPDASQCKVSASWLPKENATDGAKVNKASYPQILQGTNVQLTVDSGAAGIGELTATMHNESKKAIEVLVAMTSSPDKYKVAVPVVLDPGSYSMDLMWSGKALPASPIKFDILHRLEAADMSASGEGLVTGFTSETCKFVVDAKEKALTLNNKLVVNIHPATSMEKKASQPSSKLVSIAIKHTVIDNEDGTYSVEYTPSLAMDHLIAVEYERKHILGSPFRAAIKQHHDASKCKVSCPSKVPDPKTSSKDRTSTPTVAADGMLLTGDDAELAVDTSEAGVGQLSAETLHEESGDLVDTLIVVRTNGMYGVLLKKLSKAGTYQVSMKWSGQHVPGSPKKITVAERLTAAMVSGSGEGLKTGWTKKTSPFVVNAPQSGLETSKRLQVKVAAPQESMSGKGSTSSNARNSSPDDLAVAVKDNADGTYHVEYEPRKAGDHVVDIVFDGQSIPGSPYSVPVSASPDATLCVPGKSWRSLGNKADKTGSSAKDDDTHLCGDGLELEVDTSNGGVGELSAMTKNKDGGPVETFVVSGKDGKKSRVILPNVPKSGEYHVDVLWSGVAVKGSPFKVKVLDRLTADQITVSGDGLREGWTGVASKFAIDTVIQGVCQKGDIQVHVVPETEKSAGTTSEIPSTIGAPQGKLYSVQYTAKQAGVHMISIMYKEKHIHGSPFRAVQKQSPDASQCKVSASWLPEENATDGTKVNKGSHPKILQGTHVQLTVDSGAAGIGELTATMHNESKKAIEVLVAVTSSPDKYKVAVPVVLDPGSYSMDLKWSGKALPSSPIKFDILHRLEAADMSASGEGLATGWTNETCKFVVHAEEKGLVLSKMLDVNIQPATNEDKTRSKAPRSSSKPAASAIKPTVVDNEDGTYSVEYTPTQAVDHLIAVQHKHRDIPGSPFRAAIKQQPGASKCKVSTFGNVPDPTPRDKGAAADKLLTGDDVELAVDTSEAGVGQLSAETLHEESGDLVDTLIVVRANGVYGVLLKKLSKAGTYQVSMKWSGQHVPGSPKKITVKERLTAGMVSATGDGLKTGWTKRKSVFTVKAPQSDLVKNKRLLVKVVAPQEGLSGKGNTSSNARTSSPDDLVVVIKDNSNGTYNVEYEPRKAGDHVVDIVFDGQSIPGSPYSVPVSASPDATLCVASKSWCSLGNKADKTGSSAKNDDTHLCGDGLELEVDTSNGGVGELSAMTKNKDGGPVETFVVSGKDGEKSRVVLPNVPNSGEYHVDVLWSGVAVKGSPFKVKVLDRLTADQITVSGDGLREGWTGVASKFAIDTVIQGVCQKGDIQVHVVPETEKSAGTTSEIPSTIGAPQGKLYSVQYTAKLAGVHMISIMYKEKHIHGSPFRAVQKQSPDASQCKVSASWLPEENATDGAKVNKGSHPKILQGTHVQLIVDSGAAGIGELTATMHNESKKAIEVLVAMTSSPDKYKVAVPVVLDPGSYSMDLMWSGKALPASPIKFDIQHRLEAADMSASGEGLVTGFTSETCKFVVDAIEKALTLNNKLVVNIHPATSMEKKASQPSSKPASIAIKHTVIDNEDGTYSVEYTPSLAMDHLIAVEYERKHIPGSPFRAAIKQHHDASKCKVSCPSKVPDPKTSSKDRTSTATVAADGMLLTGDDAELAVDTSEAGVGQLSAETLHEESGDLVDTLIVVRANGMYGVLLKKLSKAGTYQVSMKWSGQHVPGSPKKITVAERLTAAMVSASGEGLKTGWTKKTSPFVVNAPQRGLETSKRLQVKVAAPQESVSGKGSTSLNARTSSPDDLVVAVKDNADGTYHVEYEPRKAGDHVVDIVFDGQSIPGSPYSVPVSASPDATLCVPGKSWRSLGNKADKTGSSAKDDDTHLCGDGLELEVDTSNGGVGELSAMAKNKDGGLVETFVVSGKDGKKSCVVLPNVPNSGEYHVDVLWSGVAVKGSPFKVKVLDRLTADQITVSGDGLREGWTSVASKFAIDTVIQGVCQKGDIQVQVVPETEKSAGATSEIPSTIGAPQGKLYSVQYTAKQAGVHMISIMYKEKHIHGSPFRAVQKQSPDASQCKVSASWLPEENATDGAKVNKGSHPKVLQGTHVQLTVDSGAAGIGELTATMHNESKKAIEVLVAMTSSPDKYKVAVPVVLDPGSYSMDLKWSGKALPASPIKFDIQHRLEAADMSASGEGLATGWTNETCKFVVHAEEKGLVLSKMLGVNIQPATNEDKTRSKAPRSSSKPAASAIKPTVVDNEDGTYSVEYTPTQAVDHLIAVQHKHRDIPGSPFRAAIKQQPGASKCKVSTLGNVPDPTPRGKGAAADKLLTGDDVELAVDTSEAGVGQLSAETLHEESGDLVDTLIVVRANGVYGVLLKKLSKAGTYQVSMKWSGQHVPGSPKKITVKERLTAGMVSATGDGLKTGWTKRKSVFTVKAPQSDLVKNKRLLVKVVAPQEGLSGKGNTSSNARTSSPDDLVVVIKDNSNGTYNVEYEPRKAGDHVVDIVFDGQSIPGSPYSVPVSASPDATLCVASKSWCSLGNKADKTGSSAKNDDTHRCGDGLELEVDTSNGGVGELSAMTKNKDGDPVETFVVSGKDGKKSRVVLPNVPKSGEYHVDVLWSGVAVKGSPFKVKVLDRLTADQITVSGDGLREGWTGTASRFAIDTVIQGVCQKGDIQVHVVPETEKSAGTTSEIPSTIGAPQGKLYSVQYTAKQAGVHMISIMYKEKHIHGSPFRAVQKQSPDASQCKVSASWLPEENATDGAKVNKGSHPKILQGTHVQLIVDSGAAGIGELTATMHNESKKAIEVLVAMTSSPDKYKVAVPVLLDPGSYSMDLKWSGKALPSSPIKFDILHRREAADMSASGDGLVSGWTNEIGKFIVHAKEKGLCLNGKLGISIQPAASAQKRATRSSSKSSPSDIKHSVSDNKDGTYLVEYTPTQAGDHLVAVQYESKNIPGSPFRALIKEQHDASKCKVSGHGKARYPVSSGKDTAAADKLLTGDDMELAVDTSEAGVGQLSADTLHEESGDLVDTLIVVRANGMYGVLLKQLPKAGTYQVSMKWSGKHVPGSPKKIIVSERLTAVMISASGDGLKTGWTRKAGAFTVKAPQSGLVKSKRLHVKVVGPQEALPARGGKPSNSQSSSVALPVAARDNTDGTYIVEYEPKKAGDHAVHISFDGQSIPGSPYSVPVSASPDATLCVPGKSWRSLGNKADKTGSSAKDDDTHLCGDGLELEVDTSNGGVGELSAMAKNKDGDPVETFVVSGKGGKKSRVVLPNVPKSGEYHVDVLWSGVAVKGSPFKVVIKDRIAANQITANGPGLVGGLTSQRLEFTVSAGKSGLFHSKALLISVAHVEQPLNSAGSNPAQSHEGQLKKAVEVDVLDKDDGTYLVRYQPAKKGDHIVNVKYKDQHTLGSPFRADIQQAPNPRGCCATASWLTGQKFQVGKDNVVNFSTKAAGVGDMSVELVDPAQQLHPVVVSHDKLSDTSSVHFRCEALGQHQLSVRWDGQQIPSSPFKFIATPPTTPHHILAAGRGLHQATAGCSESFTISAAGELPYDIKALVATLESETGYSMPVKMKGEKGTYVLSYTAPNQPGSYSIHITYYQQHIPFSPFQLEVAEAVVESKIPTDGPLLQFSHQLEGSASSKPFEFCLSRVDMHSPPPSVIITDPGGVQRKARLDHRANDVMAAQLQASQVGQYTVNVETNGDMAATPVVINVQKRAYTPSEFSVSGTGLHSAEVGTKAEVVIRGPCSGLLSDGQLTATVLPTEASSALLPGSVDVQDQYDGTYTVHYTVTSCVDHQLIVRFDGKDIPHSPFSITVDEPADSTQCKVLDNLDNVQFISGENIVLSLDTAAAGTGKLEVHAIAPGQRWIRSFLHQTANRRYDVLVPTNECGHGPYQITCTWNGVTIPGFPRHISVTEDPAQRVVKVTGRGLMEAMALKETSFCVQAWDSGLFQKGLLKIRIDGEQGQLNQSVMELQNIGSYQISYIAPVPGDYRVNITTSGRHVPGSPFPLTVLMPPHPQLCVAHGKCLESTSPIPSSAVEFTVDTAEGGNGELSVHATGPDGSSVPCYHSLAKRHVYNVKVSATASGEYVVSVLWSDEHILNSPFTLDVESKTSSSTFTTSGNALSKAYVGIPAAFSIEAMDGVLPSLDDMAVAVEGARQQKAECNIRKVSQDTFSVTYVPPSIGAYLISIKYCGKHIPGSPHKVTVYQRPRPDKCVIGGPYVEGTKFCTAGKQLPFSVATKNAGHGRLSIVAYSPRGNPVHAYTAVSNDDKTVYKVKVDTVEAGKYFINVKWNDIHVPKSPLKLRVQTPADASKVKVTGPGISPILKVGKATVVYIDTADAGFGRLAVALRGPNASTLDSKIEKSPDNPRHVHASYTPVIPGDYVIKVTWSDVPVPGSPFQVRAVDPNASAASAAASPGVKQPSKPRRSSQQKIVTSTRTYQSPPFGGAVPYGANGYPGLAIGYRPRAYSDEDIERAAQLGIKPGEEFYTGEGLSHAANVSSGTGRKLYHSVSTALEQKKSGIVDFFSKKGKSNQHTRRTSSPAILGYGAGQPMPPGMMFSRGRGQLSGDLRGQQYRSPIGAGPFTKEWEGVSADQDYSLQYGTDQSVAAQSQSVSGGHAAASEQTYKSQNYVRSMSRHDESEVFSSELNSPTDESLPVTYY